MSLLRCSLLATCLCAIAFAEPDYEPHYDNPEHEFWSSKPYRKGLLYYAMATDADRELPYAAHLAPYYRKKAYQAFEDDQSSGSKLQRLLLILEGAPVDHLDVRFLFSDLRAQLNREFPDMDPDVKQIQWDNNPEWLYLRGRLTVDPRFGAVKTQSKQLRAAINALKRSIKSGYTPAIEWPVDVYFEDCEKIKPIVDLMSFRASPEFLDIATEYGGPMAKRFIALFHLDKWKRQLGEDKPGKGQKKRIRSEVYEPLLEAARNRDAVALRALKDDYFSKHPFLAQKANDLINLGAVPDN